MITIVIRRHHILVGILSFAVLLCFVFSTIALASLSCSVATSCPTGTVIFRMSSTSNAHAELPSQSLYTNLVCCTGVTGIGNTCSAPHAVVLHLSSTTNAHVEQNDQANYTNNVCLKGPTDSVVTVAYQNTNCIGYDTTVVSISSTTNAHVGSGNVYTKKVCASMTDPTLTFLVDSPTQSLSVTPTFLAATTSILYVSTTNVTGFTMTVQKQDPVTLRLVANTAISIPDKTEWIAGGATTTAGNSSASTTEPLTLQFRIRRTGTDVPNYSNAWWGTSDATANALFGGFPSTTQAIINRSVSAVSTTTSTVLYNLNVDVTQPNGVYSGTLLYSATANP
jgi:hypothetical protein